MSSEPGPPEHPRSTLPPWARVLDLACLAIVLLAAVVAAWGGFRMRVGGIRVALTSPYRVFAVFETDDPYGSPCPYPTSGSCVISNLRAIAQ